MGRGEATVWTQREEQIIGKKEHSLKSCVIFDSPRPKGLVLPWEPLAFCAWFVSAVNRLPTRTRKKSRTAKLPKTAPILPPTTPHPNLKNRGERKRNGKWNRERERGGGAYFAENTRRPCQKRHTFTIIFHLTSNDMIILSMQQKETFKGRI